MTIKKIKLSVSFCWKCVFASDPDPAGVGLFLRLPEEGAPPDGRALPEEEGRLRGDAGAEMKRTLRLLQSNELIEPDRTWSNLIKPPQTGMRRNKNADGAELGATRRRFRWTNSELFRKESFIWEYFIQNFFCLNIKCRKHVNVQRNGSASLGFVYFAWWLLISLCCEQNARII